MRGAAQTQLKQFLTRDTRCVRLYHGGWTLDSDPDSFFPILRRLLTKPARMVRDAAVTVRWASDWRDPGGCRSALFFSAALLRANIVGATLLRANIADKVIPEYPIGEPDGTKGNPPSPIHGFAAQLGFGDASSLKGSLVLLHRAGQDPATSPLLCKFKR